MSNRRLLLGLSNLYEVPKGFVDGNTISVKGGGIDLEIYNDFLIIKDRTASIYTRLAHLRV